MDQKMGADHTDPNSPYAWITFEGAWGERQPAVYDAPTGPNTNSRWTKPITWQDKQRDSTLTIPQSKTLGPGPSNVFCDISAYGSWVVGRFAVYPWLFLAMVIFVVGVIVLLIVFGRGILGASFSLYVDHLRTFFLLGLIVIPVGILANGLDYLFVNYPPGSVIVDVMNDTPGAKLAAVMTIGGIQHLLGLILVGPEVIYAVGDVLNGQRPGVIRSYRAVWRRIRPLVRAVLRTVVIVALLAITIVGIPWAIARAVRWIFVPQTVILDGTVPRQSQRASAQVVAGHWWRTAVLTVFLALVGAAPGPLIGIALLILASRSIDFVNSLSSLLYAVALPLSVIGFTLLYRRGLGRSPVPAPSAVSNAD